MGYRKDCFPRIEQKFITVDNNAVFGRHTVNSTPFFRVGWSARRMLMVLRISVRIVLLHKIKSLVNLHAELNRLLLSLPQMVKINPADTAQRIGNHIHDIGISERHKILMDFITNTIQGR